MLHYFNSFVLTLNISEVCCSHAGCSGEGFPSQIFTLASGHAWSVKTRRFHQEAEMSNAASIWTFPSILSSVSKESDNVCSVFAPMIVEKGLEPDSRTLFYIFRDDF